MKTYLTGARLLAAGGIAGLCLTGCTSTHLAENADNEKPFITDPYQSANDQMSQLVRRNSDLKTGLAGGGTIGSTTTTAESGIVPTGGFSGGAFGAGGGGVPAGIGGGGGGGTGGTGGGGGTGIGTGAGAGGSIQLPGVGAGAGIGAGINLPGINLP